MGMPSRSYVTTLQHNPWPVPPLNSLLIDWWDAQAPGLSTASVGLVSGDVQTYTGQKRGIVRTAPGAGNRPGFAPDIAFQYRAALQFRDVGARQLRNDNVSPEVAAAGSRPYTIHAWHWVGAPKVTLSAVFMLGNIAAGGANLFGHYVGITNDVITCSYNGASPGAPIAGVGTKLHVTEFWADGTNLNTRDNGNLQSVAFVGSLNVAGISLRDGQAGGDKNGLHDGVFSAVPSADYIAAYKNWLRERHYTLG